MRMPQSPPRKRLKTLETDDDIYCFVEEAYDIVIARWEEHQRELLELNLAQHRDEIIGDLQEPKIYPRLLGNRDPPPKILQKLYCLPCSEQDQCDKGDTKIIDERNEEPYGEGSEKNMDSLTTSDDLSGDDDFTSSPSPNNKPNGPNNKRQSKPNKPPRHLNRSRWMTFRCNMRKNSSTRIRGTSPTVMTRARRSFWRLIMLS